MCSGNVALIKATVGILQTLGFPEVCFKNDLSRLVGEKLLTQILSLWRQQVSVETRKRTFDLESHFEGEDCSLSLPVTFNNSASATYVVFQAVCIILFKRLVKQCETLCRNKSASRLYSLVFLGHLYLDFFIKLLIVFFQTFENFF